MFKRILIKYAGTATILTLWVSIVRAMSIAHLSLFDQRPLSYLGSNEQARLYFRVGLILAALLLSLFYIYLKRHFTITPWFTLSFFIGQVGQVIVALVPFYGSPVLRWIHTFAAFVLAFSVPTFMYFFAKAQHNIRLQTLGYRLLGLETAAFIIGIGWFIFSHHAAPLSQALPAVMLHLWIFRITFFNTASFDVKKST